MRGLAWVSAMRFHWERNSSRLAWMYCSNWPTDLALKVCATVLRLRVCSARSRVLKRPRRMETKAS